MQTKASLMNIEHDKINRTRAKQSVASSHTPQLPMTLIFDLLTLKIDRVHPLIIGNMCTKIDKNSLNSLHSIGSQAYFYSCPLLTFDPENQ